MEEGRLAMDCFDLTVLDDLPDSSDGTVQRARAFPNGESPGVTLQAALAMAPMALLSPVTKKQQRIQKAGVSVGLGMTQLDVSKPPPRLFPSPTPTPIPPSSTSSLQGLEEKPASRGIWFIGPRFGSNQPCFPL